MPTPSSRDSSGDRPTPRLRRPAWGSCDGPWPAASAAAKSLFHFGTCLKRRCRGCARRNHRFRGGRDCRHDRWRNHGRDGGVEHDLVRPFARGLDAKDHAVGGVGRCLHRHHFVGGAGAAVGQTRSAMKNIASSTLPTQRKYRPNGTASTSPSRQCGNETNARGSFCSKRHGLARIDLAHLLPASLFASGGTTK